MATFLVFTFFRGGSFTLIHFHFSYSDVVTFLVSGNSWHNLDTSSQSTSIDMTSDASEAYYHTKQEQIVLERSARLNLDPGRGD